MRVFKRAIIIFVLAAAAQARAQISRLRDVDVTKYANSVLSLMSYSAIPDLASSNLAVSNTESGNPQISMTQLGGGATMSKTWPIYLEGALAYSRYDPVFIATDGSEQRALPLKWNSGTLQTGVGWDFPIATDWVIRPILNFAAGVMVSDLTVARTYIGSKITGDLEFLDGGSLTVGGIGGSLMLDYEFASYERDIDLELRYSYIHLQSMGGSETVSGYSDSSTASIYYRWRAPLMDWELLRRPVRYVLESSFSHYFGDQAGILGFNDLASVGLGGELDTSAYAIWITRVRLVGRYMFGYNVNGYSIGLAASF